jgi:STE24 endopeptidase
MTLTLLITYLLTVAAGYVLSALNINHLRRFGNIVPAGFEGAIDPETLAKTTAYTLEKNRLGLVESILDNMLLLLFLFGGLLGVYDSWIVTLSSSFIGCGVLFFLILSFAQTILGIPFSLYDTFKLENRYGFNTTTPKLWISDFTKSQAIDVLLLALLTATAFWLIQWSPSHWWIWVWAFMAVFSLFMMFISPYVIEPLFNKFEPISAEGLEDDIRLMMEKVGLKVGRVMQMDASRRSKHSNAYFTGIGRVKRIVLFDTLIKQMSKTEIVAVLAHEIGHWKLRHILKRIVVVELLMLGSTWLAFEALKWPGLPGLLGMNEASYPAKFIILGFIASLLSFPITPLSAWLSRRNEYAADNFACEITGEPGALASALTKLSAENLANLHPHPFYARFYYSHPPMVERVRRLMGMAEK